MTATAPDAGRIQEVFFPYANLKVREVLAARGRFVYYTTAETATRILRDRQIWMRSTMGMNDYMEVEHGFECLSAAYNAEPGKALNAALDTCFHGLAEEVKNDFNAWLPGIRQDTYMICVSEHLAAEDENGRLSMWRAYGGQAGVALVLNGAVMSINSDALGAYASPVAYLSPDAFAVEVVKIARNMENAVDYVRGLGRATLKQIVFSMFRFAVLCTKHPGFHEEREWRVVASPAMHPSALLKPAVELVRGTPQTVIKVDLQNHPDQGLVGLSLPDLLNRVIIGPCEYPQIILKAFRQLLAEAEVPEPETKIVVSGIPLRHP